MGPKQSTEVNGVPCSGNCKCTLPSNDFNFDRLFQDRPDDTYCFHTTTREKKTVSTGASFDSNGPGVSAQVTVEEGQKLYMYFRRCGFDEYFCWDCLVDQDQTWARTLYMSLIDKGFICSYNKSSNLL